MKILGMGWIEFVIILAIILIIFGPKQLPKLGRAIGKTVKNLKDGIGSGKDDEAAEENAPAAAATAASEAQIVTVESKLPAPAPASPAASQEASAPAPTVVKKTVVKKKVV